MPSSEELICAARKVLTGCDSPEEELELIHKYVELFQLWIGHRGSELAELSETDNERDTLEDLAALHSQILVRAEDLKGETAGRLQDLKAKSRALLAYADNLPKRISVFKEKKG